ncbi:MAG: adenosyl-hopene transferase HpnH [Planctomycetota bacterium]|nr:adenosyl-hopene transferase HpnH [Planctomycetota bacterium]
MRFPLSLTSKLTAYMLSRKKAGAGRFPLVLMLEPTHRCNLACKGCGRVREYRGMMTAEMTVEECLGASRECGAPVVSVAGGEPLVYERMPELVERLVGELDRHVYLCTNGLLVRQRIGEFKPDGSLYFNIHLDGLAGTHNLIVERGGVFEEAMAAIRELKSKGFHVCTNTTVYRETSPQEIADLFGLLRDLGVDGFIISPAYSYSQAKSQEVFMDRAAIRTKFVELEKLLSGFNLYASPIYMDFLTGRRELSCTPWGNPTRNPAGWRSPCYLLVDSHFSCFTDLMEKTPWGKYGPGRDPRCENCMVHCGFEPTAAMEAGRGVRDAIRTFWWQIT